MKKGLLFWFSVLLCSCNDGDLQIEAIDFDSVAVQSCAAPVTVGTRIFFKINQDEALILTLAANSLRNELSDGQIISTVPAQSQIVYRIFSGNLSSNYFCDAIPPTTPFVTEEILAQAGEVRVTTTQNADGIRFDHKIELSGISLVTETGSRITDLRINEFGTVTTTAP
ncbi:hypothetical protein U1E44_07595 [Arenibacter sp. GZD96]|uniref:hypothetical protein n=1 Tax=Aurantibrevibacter litoralis TaxID=3106030 RepID=UPI002AFE672C|nr:hypothetical protein [Arenibacter sp. GZD-96]MEA1785950.1 hypothetical protein [Arenibacter sp. GZD-96]